MRGDAAVSQDHQELEENGDDAGVSWSLLKGKYD